MTITLLQAIAKLTNDKNLFEFVAWMYENNPTMVQDIYIQAYEKIIEIKKS